MTTHDRGGQTSQFSVPCPMFTWISPETLLCPNFTQALSQGVPDFGQNYTKTKNFTLKSITLDHVNVNYKVYIKPIKNVKNIISMQLSG